MLEKKGQEHPESSKAGPQELAGCGYGIGLGVVVCCEGNLEGNVTLPDGRGVQKQKVHRGSEKSRSPVVS